MSGLRVCIDATAVPSRLTGVGVYVAGLLRAVSLRDDVDVEVLAAPAAVDALRPAESSGDPPRRESRSDPGSARARARTDGPSSVRVHPVRAPGSGRAVRIAWTHVAASRAARRVGADLLHGVHYELPLLGSVPPAVVTVHDLTFITHPEWHEAAKRAYFRWAVVRAVRKARRVFCVSKTTAGEVIDRLGADPSRVDVTPLGTDLRRARSEALERFRRRLGFDAPYIAALGTLEPRKDVAALVAAFDAVASQVPHHLVLAGLKGWGSEPWARAIAASEAGHRIHLLGYVPEGEKAALYSGADVFVYPSRFEGFGLPVLEAMACGTPVVTTTGGALPEVAGDAAALVEPGDVRAIAAAVTRLIGDAAARATLVERGRARAAAYTWERCAELTVAGYRRALDG